MQVKTRLMYCLKRTPHLFFFRNLVIHENSIVSWLSNFSCNKNILSSVILRTYTPATTTMSGETDKNDKMDGPEAITNEDLPIKDDGFFVLDSFPSPVLIDIDHPDKYRKKGQRKVSYETINAKSNSRHSKLDGSTPSSSRIHGIDSNLTKSPIDKVSANKTSSSDDKSKGQGQANTKYDDDDDILYEGTFVRDFIPFKSDKNGFFRQHLLKNSSPTRTPKRSLSSSKIPYNKDTFSKRNKTYHKSARRNRSSLIDQNEKLCDEKSFKNITNYLGRIPSNTDSDSDVIIEEEIRIDKARISSPIKSKIPSSASADDSRLFSTLVKDLEEGEISDSDSLSSRLTENEIVLKKDNLSRLKSKAKLCSSSDDSPLFSTVGRKDLEEGEISDSSSVESRLTANKTQDDLDESDVINLSDQSHHEDGRTEQVDALTSDNDDDDSVPYSYLSEQKSDSDHESVDMQFSDDDSESDIKIVVNNSDFIPLNNIKLSDIEYEVPVSDEVKQKRRELEALRKWELTGLGAEMVGSSKNVDGTMFTLLSYNVLAQQLIKDNMHLYQNCDQKFLDWSYRWALLQHEIRHLQPDIMTFQEVESAHYHSHYLPWFTLWGYKCIYKKRTGTKADGCIIAYNSHKFNLIEENSVEFYQPRGGSILDRDNIGIIAKLTPKAFDSPFCVATTHIIFNPKRGDVKLAQLVLMLTELDRICYEREEGGKPVYCPIIFTGDFNSEPYTRLLDVVRKGTLKYSGLSKRNFSRNGFGPTFEMELIPQSLGVSDHCQHKVLQQSRYFEKIRGNLFSLSDKRKIEEQLIKLSHSDRASSFEPDCCEVLPQSSAQSSGIISHSFNFKSAYYHRLRRSNQAPEVTTFQDRWVTVDYIFYTRVQSNNKLVEGDLKLIGRYGLLTPTEAMRLGSLPSDICPSDHLPLAAQFLLKRKKK